MLKEGSSDKETRMRAIAIAFCIVDRREYSKQVTLDGDDFWDVCAIYAEP
jgi:hypothetical protein